MTNVHFSRCSRAIPATLYSFVAPTFRILRDSFQVGRFSPPLIGMLDWTPTLVRLPLYASDIQELCWKYE